MPWVAATAWLPLASPRSGRASPAMTSAYGCAAIMGKDRRRCCRVPALSPSRRIIRARVGTSHTRTRRRIGLPRGEHECDRGPTCGAEGFAAKILDNGRHYRAGVNGAARILKGIALARDQVICLLVRNESDPWRLIDMSDHLAIP